MRQLVALAEAGLPVVVVNPRRVRSFGQAMGIPARTDSIDALMIALFGEKAEPPIRPILQRRARPLADLVARRRQLVATPRRTAATGLRRIRGGRASVRTALYLAAMTAARFNPVLRDLYQRLRQAGKPPKLSPVILNAHRPGKNRLASPNVLTSITIAC